jgi:hypothetical protein
MEKKIYVENKVLKLFLRKKLRNKSKFKLSKNNKKNNLLKKIKESLS